MKKILIAAAIAAALSGAAATAAEAGSGCTAKYGQCSHGGWGGGVRAR
jgi:ABC-type proline/glycine betaine transport system substrate-binding protein